MIQVINSSLCEGKTASVLQRRSCRSYKPDPVPSEILDQILEAGTYTATGMGKQSPIMIAVTDRKIRDQLSRMKI